MYLASKLDKEMDENLPPDYFIGKRITYTKLSKQLNNILKPLGARVRVIKDKGLKGKRNTFYVTGYFETENRKVPITIQVFVPPTKNGFTLSKTKYNYLRFAFSQITQHEFIHKSQFSTNPDYFEKQIRVYHSDRLSKKRIKMIEYLSERCEVEAYAHDIVLEIKNSYPKKKPETVIAHIDKYKNLPSYNLFKQTFAGTEWSKLKESLTKSMSRWISSAHLPKKVL